MAEEETLSIVIRVKNMAEKNFASLDRRLKAVGASILRVGKYIAALGTAAFIATAKLGKDFYFSMQSVAVVAGATGEQFALLTEKAKEVGATTAFSAQQVADAMYNLASAGLDTVQVMNAAEHSIKLAGATAGSMENATKMVAASLKIFGLEASEAEHVSDVLTMTTHKAMTNLEGLSFALTYAAPIAGSFGWSLEQTNAAVAQFLNLGLEGSMAGTTLRQTLSTLARPTEALDKQLAAIGVRFDQVNPATNDFESILKVLAGSTLTANEAMSMFGRTGGALFSLVEGFRQGRVNIAAFTDDLVNSAGYAAEQYDKMMDTVEGQWQIFQSGVSGIMLAIFDQYRLGLKDMLKEGNSYFETMIGLIENYGTVFEVVWDYIKERYFGFLNDAEAGSEQAFESFLRILQATGEAWNVLLVGMISIVLKASSVIWAPLGAAFRRVGDNIFFIFKGLMAQLIGSVRQLYNALPAVVKAATPGLEKALAEAHAAYLIQLDDMPKTMDARMKEAGQVVKAVTATIGEDLDTIWAAISENGKIVSGELGTTVEGLGTRISKVLTDAKAAKDAAAAAAEAGAGVVVPGVVPPEAGAAVEGMPTAPGATPIESPEKQTEKQKTQQQLWTEHWQQMQVTAADGSWKISQALMGNAQLWQNVFMTAGQSIADTMSDSMGSIISGTKKDSKAMNAAVGELVGGIAQQWGQSWILQGLAKIAESIWPPNPAGAAAGSALVAAGAALKAYGSKLGGKGQAAGGGGAVGAGAGGQAGKLGAGYESSGARPDRERRRKSKIVVNMGEGIVTNPRQFARELVKGLNDDWDDDVNLEFAKNYGS